MDLDDADPAHVLRRLRRIVPEDIAIHDVGEAPAGFDARFSAIWRRYCYRLVGSQQVLDPLLRTQVVQTRHPLEVSTMRAGAQLLTGLREFAPFCKPRDGATTIRDLKEFTVRERGDGVIELHLLADAFCHSMVRSLVGALTVVGGSKRDLAWLEATAASDRRAGDVPLMPPHGLVLEEVGYPADDELAARAVQARAVRTLEDA